MDNQMTSAMNCMIKAQRGIKNVLIPLKLDTDTTLTDNDYVSLNAEDHIHIYFDSVKNKTIFQTDDLTHEFETDLTVIEVHDLINSEFKRG
jgi:hypothetical protein